MERSLNLPVRYRRHGTDDGIRCVESEIGYAYRDLCIPAEASALVLVDCWAEHFIESHAADSSRIIRERIRPVIDACRAAGIAVVHAPSPTYVEAYPQWTAYASERDLGFDPTPVDDWPPAEFRRREGEYSAFVRLVEPKVRDWVTDPSRYRIHEAIEPRPGDFVIKNGDQLHRLLKHRKLLHLFYAGFATNICVLFRDYGTRAMSQRGYHVILLRDCTTGIENADTVEGRLLTRAAVDGIEVSSGCSATSEDFLRSVSPNA